MVSGPLWVLQVAAKRHCSDALPVLRKQLKDDICFNDQVWLDSDQKIFVPPEHRKIGYIFQEARLFPHLTVAGNLNFASQRVSGKKKFKQNDIIQLCGITHLLDRSVTRLSGGEKQRVAIARALLGSPDLLLMDEPLASLDWKARNELLSCLRAVYQRFQIPVVMVSHSREEVASLADSVVVMDKGRIVQTGDVSSIVASYFSSEEKLVLLNPLNATVVGHDDEYLLTELDVEGIRLLANQSDKEIGETVRLVISAQEISLVLDDVQHTSIQNRLRLTIKSIKPADDYHQLVELNLGKQAMVAMVTRKSTEHLDLKAGQSIFAHIKASGLEII